MSSRSLESIYLLQKWMMKSWLNTSGCIPSKFAGMWICTLFGRAAAGISNGTLADADFRKIILGFLIKGVNCWHVTHALLSFASSNQGIPLQSQKDVQVATESVYVAVEKPVSALRSMNHC